ncbi:hypothetical protein SB778_43475, partial [Paraburkholderia sp. SIMBA_050]
MDQFALNVGNAVVDTLIGISLVLMAVYAAIKLPWFARAMKIAFLLAWAACIFGAPITAVTISGPSGFPAAAYVACGLFV